MSILLRLKPINENADFTDIVVKISNKEDINLKDFIVEQPHESFFDYLDEIQKYIIENGVTSLLTISELNESVVPRGTPTDKIIEILHKYLDKISIDQELIIIDPYFFARNTDTTYPNTIFDVLSKFLPVINTLIIITNNRVDNLIKTSIQNLLQNAKPSISIIHKTTDNFHDRFWISNNREKGIVTGTSLNGLGRKIALIDRLNITDVRDIIASLDLEGLL